MLTDFSVRGKFALLVLLPEAITLLKIEWDGLRDISQSQLERLITDPDDLPEDQSSDRISLLRDIVASRTLQREYRTEPDSSAAWFLLLERRNQAGEALGLPNEGEKKADNVEVEVDNVDKDEKLRRLRKRQRRNYKC